jgi:hypothetical protein
MIPQDYYRAISHIAFIHYEISWIEKPQTSSLHNPATGKSCAHDHTIHEKN